MDLRCDRRELLEAVGLGLQVVASRTTRPVLANLCLERQKDALFVLATDLEVGLRVRCERADGVSAGRVLLDAQRTHAILRELPGDEVTIAEDDGTVLLRSGGSEFRLVSEDAREFPEVRDFESDRSFALPRQELEQLIKKTSFAAAAEAHRYALNGVLFELAATRLRLVATDGKRLALTEHRLPEPTGADVSRVVSNKAIQLIARLGGAADETLALRFGENQVQVRSSRAVLTAQLVQGKFPPYEEVLPKGLDKHVDIDVVELTAALKRSALLTTKESLAVRFKLTHHKLTLSARLAGVGQSTIEIPVAFKHDPFETAFNPQYLLEALRVFEGTRAVLEIKDPAAPCILREASSDEGQGDGFRYVVMPIELP